jgi:hypothetical protein
MTGVVGEVLRVLLRADGLPRRIVRPAPAVERYRDTVNGLLASWDDGVADAAFAMNMDLDEPRGVRRAGVAKVAELGPFTPDAGRPEVSLSPAHLEWWLRGDRGWAQCELLVSPEPSPRIQSLRVTAVPDPAPELFAAASRLLEAAPGEPPAWPVALVAGEGLKVAEVLRELHAGAVRFGTMALGAVTSSEPGSAAWDLVTERGRATLRVALDAVAGAVTAVELRVPARTLPHEGW